MAQAIPTACAVSRFRLPPAILQLADVYDALTTDRPYRKASPSDVGLQIMEDEATLGWWDRNLFDAFRDMIRDGHAAPPATLRRGAAS